MIAGALVLAGGVALGAVSAHAAKSAPHPEAARLLQTAVQYQLVHGLGLLAVGILARGAAPSRLLATSGALLLAGIAAFCGSLYSLAFAAVSLGLLAPVGGAAFMAGWVVLALWALLERGD
ncbi:MAG: DUF423 domain-containing protein [Betaproteobacteria bacterium]|nr:DUF423 domain-containing protein [Betaproteobacteria bacterium]